MTVRIEIDGENAAAILKDLAALAFALIDAKPPAHAPTPLPIVAPIAEDVDVNRKLPEFVKQDEEQPTEKKRRGRPAKAKDTGTTEAGEETPAEAIVTSPTATEAAPAPTDTSTDDDEFAAFAAASAKVEAQKEEAAASVPARKWTDADLGALCNQAAQKLGRPDPIKELIAKFVPKGEVAHSRNVPEENRHEFAQAVEAVAGIEFAG